jgi:hypothetical protein
MKPNDLKGQQVMREYLEYQNKIQLCDAFAHLAVVKNDVLQLQQVVVTTKSRLWPAPVLLPRRTTTCLLS